MGGKGKGREWEGEGFSVIDWKGQRGRKRKEEKEDSLTFSIHQTPKECCLPPKSQNNQKAALFWGPIYFS